MKEKEDADKAALTDAAMVTAPAMTDLTLDARRKRQDVKNGGIDFNPENLNIDVEQNGEGFVMPAFDPAMLKGINPATIEGFVPVIINVAPVTNLPLLLGIVDETTPFNSAQDQNTSKDLSFLDRKFRHEFV